MRRLLLYFSARVIKTMTSKDTPRWYTDVYKSYQLTHSLIHYINSNNIYHTQDTFSNGWINNSENYISIYISNISLYSYVNFISINTVHVFLYFIENCHAKFIKLPLLRLRTTRWSDMLDKSLHLAKPSSRVEFLTIR